MKSVTEIAIFPMSVRVETRDWWDATTDSPPAARRMAVGFSSKPGWP